MRTREELNELAGKYSQAAADSQTEYDKLSEGQKKVVKKLKTARAAKMKERDRALNGLAIDFQNGALERPEYESLKAQLQGRYVAEIGDIDAQLTAVYPGWRVKEKMDAAIAKGGHKAGKGAGKALRGTFQAAKNFGKGFFHEANDKEIETEEHGLLS